MRFQGIFTQQCFLQRKSEPVENDLCYVKKTESQSFACFGLQRRLWVLTPTSTHFSSLWRPIFPFSIVTRLHEFRVIDTGTRSEFAIGHGSNKPYLDHGDHGWSWPTRQKLGMDWRWLADGQRSAAPLTGWRTAAGKLKSRMVNWNLCTVRKPVNWNPGW